MRPNATKLTARQRAAMTALVAGASVQDAARAARVHRSTLHRWTRSELFAAELETECSAIRDLARKQALALASDAIATMREAIAGGRWEAAARLLAGVGVLDSKKTLDLQAGSRAPRVVIHIPHNFRDPLEGLETDGGNASR